MTTDNYKLPIIMTVKESWAKTNGAKGAVWTVGGAIVLLAVVVTLASILIHVGLVLARMPAHSTVGQFLIFAAVIPLGFVMYLLVNGLYYIGIQKAIGLSVQFSLVKHVFKIRTVINLVGFVALCVLLYFLFISPILVAQFLYQHNDLYESGAVIKLVVAALNIIGIGSGLYFIYLSIGFYLGRGLILKEGMGPWQALKTSLRAIKSNRCRLLALLFIKIIMVVLGAMLLGIGLIWIVPYCFVNYGVIYDKLLTSRRD